ncbi:MAG TPA: LacI family DNA-binding transcriptional regulator, partial [Methylomirabilota bacterium]|nr:LacI family DNA-binding transcriptional regulator [Methylomirabilota bacterium]
MRRVTRSSRPTMMDVASRAGVSQTTVSLVLNGALGARLSEPTRQRVLAAAKSIGYQHVRRGSSAKSFADKTVIGMIIDEISTDPWMALAIAGIREKAWEYGFLVSVVPTRGDGEMEEAAHSLMAGQPLIGLIYGTIQTR